MNNIHVQDVCEVYLKDLSDPTKVFFFGITISNEVTAQIQQEVLRGGISNVVYGVAQSNKEMSFNVKTLFHNDDLYSIQMGSNFSSGSTIIQKSEQGTVSAGKVTITGTPQGTACVVIDGLGKQYVGTYATGQVTITTPPSDGTVVTVVYPSTVTAQILDLNSKTFPKNYYVELHTIAWDIDKNTVVADIYWVFEKAMPNGGLTASYEAGKGNGDDITFTAQCKVGSSSFGKYLTVARA
jgi:hypothetical protein